MSFLAARGSQSLKLAGRYRDWGNGKSFERPSLILTVGLTLIDKHESRMSRQDELIRHRAKSESLDLQWASKAVLAGGGGSSLSANWKRDSVAYIAQAPISGLSCRLGTYPRQRFNSACTSRYMWHKHVIHTFIHEQVYIDISTGTRTNDLVSTRS